MTNNFKFFTNLKKISNWCLRGVACIGLYSTSTWSMEVREVRILAIEGEGVRAIIPLTVLDKMEEQLQGKVNFSEYFDIITGTVSGAHLIAEGLYANIPAEDLLKQYRDGVTLAKSTTASVDTVTVANDPTCIAIKQMQEKHPGSNYFILTLGSGYTPSYDINSPENIKKSAWIELFKGIKEQGRSVEHINIDVSISSDLVAPNAVKNAQSLRQAGLSICNSMNPRGSHQDIQKIVKKMCDSKNQKK